MTTTSVFRTDPTNVGDWHCAPVRYFPELAGPEVDVLQVTKGSLQGNVVVGGGGLIAATFSASMQTVADGRAEMDSLVAWGIGESLNIDRAGGFVLPYNGRLPDYLDAFDLVGVRDFGTDYRWVPCVSCMSPQFDDPPPPTHEVVIYEHKRIPIPIDGPPRMSNGVDSLDVALSFLASGEVVLTNSYHGAYWATLLGRKVVGIPNMSKLYRLKHSPVLTRVEHWKRACAVAKSHPEALQECRQATLVFRDEVRNLHKRRE